MHFKCFWEIPKRRPVFFPTARLKIKGSNGITATKEGRPTTVATFPNPSNWPKCTGATQGSLARLFGVNSEDIIPNFPSFQKLKSLNSKGVPQIKTKHATSILGLHKTQNRSYCLVRLVFCVFSLILYCRGQQTLRIKSAIQLNRKNSFSVLVRDFPFLFLFCSSARESRFVRHGGHRPRVSCGGQEKVDMERRCPWGHV